MHLLLRNRIATFVLLVLGAWSGEAAAVFCPIQPFHVTFWVGDKASHAMCGFDTIQDAVDAVQCPNTEIVVTHEHTYTAQRITIKDKPSMTLTGADVPVACGAEPLAGSTFQLPINGSGNGAKSVFTINNSDVTFRNLDISGGHAAVNERGGGISAAGSSRVTLQQSTVEDNAADFGGGIAVVDTGTLTIQDNVSIIANTARANGGGVYLAGSAHMDMRGDSSTIAANQATGHDGDFGFGGGVCATGNAVADIGSPSGAIVFNSARLGGGAAAVGINDDNTAVRLFSLDPSHPMLVFGNSASVRGGGLFSSGGGGNSGEICAQDFRVDGNRAPDGAAIYAADSVFLNTRLGLHLCNEDAFAASGIGAPVCVVGQSAPCNEVSNNHALTAAGDPSGGAVISGSSPAISALHLNRTTLRDNTGGEIIYAVDNFDVQLSNCLIADNHSGHEVLHSKHYLAVGNCTIADNTIDNGSVIFAADSGLFFEDSLVWEPGHGSIDYRSDGGCASGTCITGVLNILTNDASGFAIDSSNVIATQDMGFVDGNNPDPDKRDYHLGAWTLNGTMLLPQAIDFAAPTAFVDNHDLDFHPHDQDIPIAADFLGTHDLGCYELQASQVISDRIFADSYGDRISLLF